MGIKNGSWYGVELYEMMAAKNPRVWPNVPHGRAVSCPGETLVCH